MKKFTLSLSLLSVFLCGLLNAEANTITEAKFSYFYPTSGTIREVYGSGINYEFAFSYFVWKGLAVKAAVDYFSKDGNATGDGSKTNIKIIPASLGPFYEYSWDRVSLYGGAGMRYFFVKIKNDSQYVSRKSYGNGMGGYVEIGSFVKVNKVIFFDLFASYSFRHLSFSSSSAPTNVTQDSLEVGGLNLGGGIAFRF